jgi:phenylacetate-CoA ligase
MVPKKRGMIMGSINKFRLLNHVRRNQWLKPSELEDLQNKKLRSIIKHAYYNTEFYHRKFKDAGIRPEDIRTINDLNKIPFTTKQEVRDHSLGSILAKNTDLSKCKIIPTSGSTGKPLKSVYDNKADDFSKAVNLRSLMENGLKFRDKWVNIGDTRTTNNPSWFQKLGFFNLHTLNLFDNIEDQVNALIKMNPDTIMGYPSQLKLISHYIKTNSINSINPKNVFTTAELLDPNTRELINSAFDVELVDLFGCIEVNRTGWECSEHCGYHLDVDSVFTEFIKDGENVASEERGNIVYTCLYNYSMPLIRYEVGDVGIPTDELCSCGRSLPLMKSIEGRCDDFIALPNGEHVSPIVLALLMKHTNGVLEYQIIQKKLDEVLIEMVVSNNVTNEKLEQIKLEAQKYLKNLVLVEIKLTDKIKRGSTGKIRSVISNIGSKTD